MDDGRIITLSDSMKQSIARGITNADGQLLYNQGTITSGVGWHVLNTPAGGGYMVILPDESKVWLNASSSLRYPPVFTGSHRRVDLKGEGYFEVKHNSKMPFVVNLPNHTQVTVLGTSFNVNAYDDEPAIKTTLFEGIVRVNSADTSRYLTIEPGQQAIITPDGKMSMVRLQNVNDASAWHNGYFEFNDETMEPIMRSIARWYDAEIIYESRPTYHFNASIRRDEPVSKLLKMLQMTNRVHFEVKDRKIIVNR
jgi:ferric-dicitrate binding protein FerR (iron transport regulator)